MGDQETGQNADRLYDFFIAENMAEYATMKYLTMHPDVKVAKGNEISKVHAEINFRKFPD